MPNAKYIIEAQTRDDRLVVHASTNMRGCAYYLKNNEGILKDVKLYEVKEVKELDLEMINLAIKNY